MAKRKKKPKEKPGVAPWLITFSDMMTLMLTFFVLLVSMSTMDERRKLIVLGSLVGTFGFGQYGYDERSLTDKRITVEPGPMEDIDDMQPLTDLLWEDLENDIDFQSNKFVQILSINDKVLFEPGDSILKPEGMRILNRILPVLLEIEYPLLLAGHTSTWREEFRNEPITEHLEQDIDPSWDLALQRILSIYRYFLENGVDEERLRVEAFGRYHPKVSDDTPEGRQRNRRVDIVLDKRNADWIERYEAGTPSPDLDTDFSYRDFLFDLFSPDKGQE